MQIYESYISENSFKNRGDQRFAQPKILFPWEAVHVCKRMTESMENLTHFLG